jgi:hypothetical protein
MRTPIKTIDSTKYEKKYDYKKPPTGMDREFIAWDGEGYTEHDYLCKAQGNLQDNCIGCPHHYFLFGSSSDSGISGESLGTYECLQQMLSVAGSNPHAIHVGFAFEYDVNMILRDVSYLNLRDLMENTTTTWRGFKIEHIPKKWFQVSGMHKGKWITCRIQDVFSFFACSFVKALRGWKVGDESVIADIESGKDQRGNFSLDQLDSVVRPYWRKELELLVQLSSRLRTNLFEAGIQPNGWYGPGTVASAIYKREGMERHLDKALDSRIIDASACAYMGGRFETFQAGLYEGPVYSADINSAYPHAMRMLPSLQGGQWEHSQNEDYIRSMANRFPAMGIYRVRFRAGEEFGKRFASAVPFPKPHRFKHGGVSWPVLSEGWVFEPEFNMLVKGYGDYIDVPEAWIFHDNGTRPFGWVSDMYEQRKRWKKEGREAQLALKLGLNSMYGKLAQRTGWNEDTHEPPKWHQLEYAGWITSMCRAMIQLTAYGIGTDFKTGKGLIAIETDGIYSSLPFKTKRMLGKPGDGLGDWEMAKYSGILYLQNGVYWLRDLEGNWQKPKSRGIPQKQLDIEKAFDALRTGDPLQARQHNFVGYGLSVHRNSMGNWRRWISSKKGFQFGGGGKRLHVSEFCRSCKRGLGLDEGMHYLSVIPVAKEDQVSQSHNLPWRDDDSFIKRQIQIHDKWEIV